MPKVRITNLKPGACVINSLKVTIAGYGSVTRDASVVGDADLTELESYGIVSVTPIEDVQRQATPQPPRQTPAPPPAQPPASHGKPVAPPKQRPRPGTDFRSVDPEDQYVTRRREDGSEELVPVAPRDQAKVVIVGENGPQVKKMRPSINNIDGPKYAGDESWRDEQGKPDGQQADTPPASQGQDVDGEGFTTI